MEQIEQRSSPISDGNGRFHCLLNFAFGTLPGAAQRKGSAMKRVIQRNHLEWSTYPSPIAGILAPLVPTE